MHIVRWMSMVAVGTALFFGHLVPLSAETEKAPPLYHTTKPDMSPWEVENSWDFIVGDYFVGVQRNLRDKRDFAWGAQFELNGIDDPLTYAWLDVELNLRIGLMGENGIVIGDRISYDILEDTDVLPPRGVVRAQLYDAHDTVIAERKITTYLIPVPKKEAECIFKYAIPWMIGEIFFGRTALWKCGKDKQIYTHIHMFEIVLEFWNTGGKENAAFVAMTLENGHRIATNVYDTMSLLTPDEGEGTLTVRLLVDGKLHQRKIILPKKPRMTRQQEL